MPLMNPSRFGPLLLLAVGLTLGLAFGLGDHRAEAQVGTRTIAVSGIASVEGQPVLVHILAVVGPNEQAGDVAAAVLAQQGARPLTSSEYSLTGSVDWNDDPGLGPGIQAVFNYNPANEPAGGQEAFLYSLGTWTYPISSFAVSKSPGTTNRLPSLVRETPGPQTFDGENDVAWMNLKGRNTLAVTWSGTSNGSPEADITMNTDWDWYTPIDPGVYDSETVLLHELGHGIGIGHSQVPGTVMAPGSTAASCGSCSRTTWTPYTHSTATVPRPSPLPRSAASPPAPTACPTPRTSRCSHGRPTENRSTSQGA